MRFLPRLSLVIGFLFLVVGCGNDQPEGAPGAGGDGAQGNPAASGPPATEVGVVVVDTSAYGPAVEVPGRMQAVRISEVRARVDGIVERRVYTEGTDVRAGQTLFVIDPRPMRANLNAAEAALARAEAMAVNAAQDATRFEGLVEQQAISQQEYDAAVARQRTAEADVALARAQVEQASLNLAYTNVTAPIGGRAGRALVTEGALVSAGAATLLTRIEQLDPIYVNFSQSSSDVMRWRNDNASMSDMKVQLVLEDGSVYPAEGKLNFLDLSIDVGTGSTALRAEFPNPERRLLPGQFVRVRLQAPATEGAILIPQRAVTLGNESASVFVVGENDTVEIRPVTVGSLLGDQWLILDGLAVGDRVIVDGLQKVAPGATVRIAP